MSRGFDKNGKFYSGHSPDRILNNVTPESTLNNFTIEPTVFTNISTSIANESTQIKGDINNDGKVDDDDVELMGKYLIHEVGEEELYNADLNGKDGIDIVDYQMLLDIIAEMKRQKPTGVKGDINNDGKVDEDDVALMEKYLIHEVGEEEIYNADLNGKDGIDIVDYQMLLDIIAEIKKQKSTEEKDDISNIEKIRIELENPDKRIEYNNYYEQAKGQLLENGEVVDANLIEKIDINNDGKVDWEDLQELRALLNTYAVEEAEEAETDTAIPPVEEETKPPILLDALAVDFNGDGVVNDADINWIRHAILHEDESMNEYDLRQRMDLNHDGKIDSIDFTLAVNLSQGKEIFDMPGTSKDNPIYRVGEYVCNNPNGEYVSKEYASRSKGDEYYFI